LKSKLVLTLAALSATAPLYATTLSTGHVDVGVAFEEGAFHLHIHDEDTDTEFEPDEAILQVGALAHKVRPGGAAYNFLGNPGDMLWILEQVQDPNLLFLGIGSEEIADGTLTGDEYTFSLVSVTHANGGHFSLYEVDGFNNPTVMLNSGDGINGADSFVLPTGGHADFNWAFTQEGEYEIAFKVDGLDGVTPVTQTATYTFDVVPEPTSALLLATSALALLGRRRRA
jgi:surface-anchored protein